MVQSLMDNWGAAAANRAALYGWLASLLSQELTQEQYQAYGRGDAAGLLDLLAGIGLEQESARLRQAIAGFGQQGLDFIDLKSDFAQLFLMDGKHSAMPYASFYLEASQQLYGDAEKRMREFLAKSGLRVDQDFREPADHLSVYLALVQKWVQQPAGQREQMAAAAREQAVFLQDALLCWLPAFVERTEAAVGLGHDFYPALARLLLVFVREDAAGLQELARELEGIAH